MGFELFQCDGPDAKRCSCIKVNDFEGVFDQGKDITGSLDISRARCPKQQQKRENVDFPIWMIEMLGMEAGISLLTASVKAV